MGGRWVASYPPPVTATPNSGRKPASMARTFIDKNGIIIAKPGYSHTAGQQHLNFSNLCIAMAVYMSGTVSLTGPGVDTGAPDPYNNRYRKATVSFGKTFSVPPIVIFSCITSDGTVSYLPVRGVEGSSVIGGVKRSRWEPYHFVAITTTNFTIWNVQANIGSAAFVVLENTLS